MLFGSVTSADIGRELVEKGFDIDKRRVHLDDVIKEIGNFEAVVSIHREINVTVPVHVIRPGGQVEEDVEEVVEEAETASAETGPTEEVEAEEPVVE